MAITFVGSSEQGINNGGNATITFSPVSSGDYILLAVTLGTTRTVGGVVTSSSGASNYTTILSTITSSNCRFAMYRRLVTSTGETQVNITGTAGSSDSLATIAMVFRGVDQTTPEDATVTSTTGSGTTPDSPSITVASVQCAIISAWGAQINDAIVTQPSSFLNPATVASNDTINASCGQAWITNSSSAAYDPTSWSGLTSATWISATVALRPATPTWFMPPTFSEPDNTPIERVGY